MAADGSLRATDYAKAAAAWDSAGRDNETFAATYQRSAAAWDKGAAAWDRGAAAWDRGAAAWDRGAAAWRVVKLFGDGQHAVAARGVAVGHRPDARLSHQ